MAVLLLCAQPVQADSTRIEVYPISQNYRDVSAGDTLGGIAAELLPDSPDLRRRLMRTIVESNPDVFIDGDPNRMRADTRLWLPNSLERPVSHPDSSAYTVENFSWGSLRRPNN